MILFFFFRLALVILVSASDAAPVASENPDAVFISGDLPFQGASFSDYKVFERATKIWRGKHLRIYPVLGNHEFYSRSLLVNRQGGLDNWWKEFPEWHRVADVLTVCIRALGQDYSPHRDYCGVIRRIHLSDMATRANLDS